MPKRTLSTTGLALLVLCLSAVTGMAAPTASMEFEPKVISIGAMYNGAKVTVTGHIPSGAQVLVQITGARQDTVLSQKGKAFGLLWMNTGEITMHNAPTVYMLYLPEAYSPDMPGEAWWHELGVGFDVLREQIEITSSNKKTGREFDEFIKLKQKEGLYAVRASAVEYQADSGSVRPFSCKVSVPPRMHQGTYELAAIVVKDGKVLDKITEQLKIRYTGVTELLGRLAFSNGTLYGILASLVALLAGLLMGLAFRGGKGGAH